MRYSFVIVCGSLILNGVAVADVYYVGLMREEGTNSFFWHDGTPYDMSLNVPKSDNNQTIYIIYNDNFNDSGGAKARQFLCQANFDRIAW